MKPKLRKTKIVCTMGPRLFENDLIRPLMLAGIEYALNRQGNAENGRPLAGYVPFAVFTAVAALSNFYFFYVRVQE